MRSLSNQEDTMLPISIEIKTKFLLLFLPRFLGKIFFALLYCAALYCTVQFRRVGTALQPVLHCSLQCSLHYSQHLSLHYNLKCSAINAMQWASQFDFYLFLFKYLYIEKCWETQLATDSGSSGSFFAKCNSFL